MTTVLCVLKAGGEYLPKHAARLYDQFLRHAPPEVRFLCLTDLVPELDKLNVPAAPLTHGWPGWWSKVETLAAPGPCLYLDLDTSIVGDIEPLLAVARDAPLCMCRSFWVEDPGAVNSSVMAWSGDVSWLYRRFAEAPEEHMSLYKARDRWGDQVWLHDNLGLEPWLWQDELPGQVLSFKRDVLRGADCGNVRVIVSHGLPRPWQAGGADEWMKVS